MHNLAHRVQAGRQRSVFTLRQDFDSPVHKEAECIKPVFADSKAVTAAPPAVTHAIKTVFALRLRWTEELRMRTNALPA